MTADAGTSGASDGAGAVSADHLRIALEATPLLGVRTGVGMFCRDALAALTRRADLSVGAFAVTWRRRQLLADALPPGVSHRQRAMPARPLYRAWRTRSWPPVEWFIGAADVVHGTNFVVPPTRRAARVVTVHDLTVVRFPELCDSATLAFPELVRRAVAQGAWVHTHSRFVADEVVAIFGADPRRVRAVAPGVPVMAAPAPGSARDILGLDPQIGRYILAVGTIEPRKDYPGLIEAFDRLGSSWPDVALVIVGADGWGAEAVARAVERSPRRRKIIRPGYLSDGDVARVRADAAVLAYPSRYEGFGFPPLEAMAVGVPVVATAAGSVPEVVGDGAVVVAVGDPDALAQGLDQVLSGSGTEALIERGRRRASGYTWAGFAGVMTELYREAAGR